jgi:hypothetical protein
VTLRSPHSLRADALVRAVLVAQWPLPVPTGEIEERVGMPGDPVVLRMLNRMASLGKAEKLNVPDMKSRYWRLASRPESPLAPGPQADVEAMTARPVQPRQPGPGAQAQGEAEPEAGT